MLKLLNMALITEFECEVLSLNSRRNVVETAQRVAPDLVIIDANLLDGSALDLADQLHSIPELASVPTLLMNMQTPSERMAQRDHTIVLEGPFVLVDVYAAVRTCLGSA